MINLSNVTLVCVDNKRVYPAMRAIKHTQKIGKFAKTLFFSDAKAELEGCEMVPCEISSVRDYSNFMVRDLRNFITTDFVMVIQWDGFPLNEQAWKPEFLEYDYIGAPWTPGYNWAPGMPPCTEETRVGNGGFSIRSKKLLDASEVLSQKYTNVNPEDVFIVRQIRPELDKLGIKFAPYSLAERFSVEDNYYTGQFGFHGQQTIMMNKFLKDAFVL